MRHQGRIAKWKDEQGFGFITPTGGGGEVFVHIKAFSNRQRRPKTAEFVTYELKSDAEGRMRAENVAFIDDTPVPSVRDQGKLLVWPAMLFLILIAAVFMRRLPFHVLVFYAVVSTLTFLVYSADKSAAQKNERRTREDALHVLSLIGGWPGAVVAQELLRHKSAKQAFRRVFWITVVLNSLGLVWLLSPPGAAALRSLVGPY